MPPQIEQLRRRAAGALSGFSSGQKAVTIIAVVGLLLGGYLFTSWASQPSYVPLFSNLSASDASAITQKLSSQHVAYQLTNGGQTIMVPQSRVYQTRIDLSATGLPSGGTQGYSLLDKQGITTSEFTQKVDYQRALEGELTKTIEAIDGVQSARVHLVIPAQDVFATSAQKPSASVLLMSAPGRTVSPGQAQAIVHLVSASVESLDPANVTVADTTGRILSTTGADGVSSASGDTQTSQTRTFQDNMASSLSDMLSKVLGPNHAVVQVSADLNYDQSQTTTESFGSNKAAPTVSETTNSETFSGAGAPTAAGVLSPTATTLTATNGPGSSYKKDDATRTFAVDKVTAVVKQAPGTIRRLSVAVALDANAKSADKATVEQLVSAAAGISAARGDTVSVDQMAFDTAGATQAAKELKAAAAARSQAGLMSLAKSVGLFLAVMIALGLLLRASRKQSVRVPLALPPGMAELEASGVDYPRAQALVGAGVGSGAVPMRRSADVGGGLLDHAVMNAPHLEAPSAELTALIERQPEEVAQLLRGWIGDRRN